MSTRTCFYFSLNWHPHAVYLLYTLHIFPTTHLALNKNEHDKFPFVIHFVWTINSANLEMAMSMKIAIHFVWTINSENLEMAMSMKICVRECCQKFVRYAFLFESTCALWKIWLQDLNIKHQGVKIRSCQILISDDIKLRLKDFLIIYSNVVIWTTYFFR